MVGFPLLLIPLALYNIIVFLMPSVSFVDTLFRVPMVSGVEWPVTLSDVLIALGIILLLLEVIKGARPGAKFLMDHLLSLIVFGAAAAEFVMWPKFANSSYFLLTLLAMTDFLTSVALRTRRRVVMTEVAPIPRRAREKAEPPEPQAEPAPPQPVVQASPEPTPPTPQPEPPSARSIAESVLKDHPAAGSQSSPAQPAPAPASPPASPEINSPHLQPNSTPPAAPDEPRLD